jgi:hypothetical protein
VGKESEKGQKREHKMRQISNLESKKAIVDNFFAKR